MTSRQHRGIDLASRAGELLTRAAAGSWRAKQHPFRCYIRLRTLAPANRTPRSPSTETQRIEGARRNRRVWPPRRGTPSIAGSWPLMACATAICNACSTRMFRQIFSQSIADLPPSAASFACRGSWINPESPQDSPLSGDRSRTPRYRRGAHHPADLHGYLKSCCRMKKSSRTEKDSD